MKKLLLASVLAIASATASHAADIRTMTSEQAERLCGKNNEHCDPSDLEEQCATYKDLEHCNVGEIPPRRAPAQVTVTPPYQGPPPIGWVYGPYTQCANPPQCSMGVVNVGADGLNVRTVPNGYPVMSLVNGVPLYPLGRQGDWLLVASACDLTPTFAWSWTAGVPLNRCWVYF